MKNALRRTLSLMLTVVMLVSCWVFTAPKADAATAGNYTVVVKFTVNDATDSKHMEDSWIKIDYKYNNGTGDSTSHTWDLDNSTLIGSTGNKTVSVTVAGYPTKVYLHLDQQGTGFGWLNTDNLDVKVYEVTVQGISVWTGSVQTASEKIGHTEESGIGNSPYANSITAISGDSTVNVSTTNSSVTKTYSLGTVKDQYGVNWYQDASWDTATVSNGVSFSNGTLTVPSSSNRSSNYTVTLKEKCGNASNTKTVTIGTFDYKVTFYDENGTTVLKAEQTVDYGASATAPNDPTKSYDSSKHYAFAGWTGDGYTTIKTGSQTKTVKASYTGTSHTPSNTEKYLKSAATCTANAVYFQQCSGCDYQYSTTWTKSNTATGHDITNVDWTTDDTYHWKVCKNKCGVPQDKAAHSGNAWTNWNPDGSVGGVAKHTKTCGICGYVLSENHTYTAPEVKEAALKTPATCDGPAVYYYSCSVCGKVEKNDSHTFTNGSALSVHNLGNWTQFTGTETYKGIGESEATNHDGTLQHKAVCQDFASHVKYENHSWNIGYNPESLPAGVTPKEGYSYDGRLNPETGVSTGEHYYICPSCNYLKYESHSFVRADEDCVEPTCTSDGYDVYRCACGYSYTVAVPKIPHTYPNDGEYVVITPSTCTTEGIKQRVCSVCGTVDSQAIPALGHSMQRVDFEPQNGIYNIGSVCFQCANCGLYQGAEYSETDKEYKPVGDLVSEPSEIEKENIPIVPTTVFNEYAENNMDFEHDYASRGGSLKIAGPSVVDITSESALNKITQGMRFTASLLVPEDVALNCSVSDNYIVDFGFLYSQVSVLEKNNMTVSDLRFNESTEETELPEKIVYKMSVVKNNKGVDATEGTNDNFTGDNWTGVSAHEDFSTGGTALTFNILINVKARNWKKDYCVRPYIKYKYNGIIYTIYDDGDGFDTEYSRNVAYVAQEVYDSPTETPKAHQYCETKILNNLVYIPE